MVRIIPLIAEHRLARHLTIEVDIFAVTFPHTAPQRLTPQIHHGRIDPRNETRTALIGRYFADAARNVAIEGSRLSHLLRKEGCPPGVAGTMNLIYTIDLRHTGTRLHRPLVELPDEGTPCFRFLRHTLGNIQNAAHMILVKHFLKCSLIQAEVTALSIGDDIDGQLAHLTYLLVQREARQRLLHLLFHPFIARNGLRVGGSCRCC